MKKQKPYTKLMDFVYKNYGIEAQKAAIVKRLEDPNLSQDERDALERELRWVSDPNNFKVY